MKDSEKMSSNVCTGSCKYCHKTSNQHYCETYEQWLLDDVRGKKVGLTNREREDAVLRIAGTENNI